MCANGVQLLMLSLLYSKKKPRSIHDLGYSGNLSIRAAVIHE